VGQEARLRAAHRRWKRGPQKTHAPDIARQLARKTVRRFVLGDERSYDPRRVLPRGGLDGRDVRRQVRTQYRQPYASAVRASASLTSLSCSPRARPVARRWSASMSVQGDARNASGGPPGGPPSRTRTWAPRRVSSMCSFIEPWPESLRFVRALRVDGSTSGRRPPILARGGAGGA
jgi:hypothetical protein